MGGSGRARGEGGERTTWPVKGDARGSSSELTGRLGVTRLVKVTATPVWLSNSVFTWLAQLVRILCEATYHPCFVNAPAGERGRLVSSNISFFLHSNVSTEESWMKKELPNGITMWRSGKKSKLLNKK